MQYSFESSLGRPRIKCVVWDLDNTLWDGVLLEGGSARIRPEIVDLIRDLDAVGILHSVASRNDYDAAMAVLEKAEVADLFLFPQINWNPKSQAMESIAAALNIGIDALAFVDDQEFERAEVARAHPQVLCVDAAEIFEAAKLPCFQPEVITAESKLRRQMYRDAIQRDSAQRQFVGANEEFLATLGLNLRVVAATQEDLERTYELVTTTNQLNSTGRTYPYEELERLLTSPEHLLLVASLTDRYGSYGKIGFALIERRADCWHLRLLIVSCRVVARGIGKMLLNYIMSLAKASEVRLRADLVETGRNRLMYVTYKFAGFREVERAGNEIVFESGPVGHEPIPDYVTADLPDRGSLLLGNGSPAAVSGKDGR